MSININKFYTKYKCQSVDNLYRISVMLLSSFICLLCTSICKADPTNVSEASSTTKNTSFLFVQTAAEATIKKLNSGEYQISLKKLAPYITFFTDRPARKSGVLPLDKFLEEWSNKKENNFGQNPPNAYIHAYSDSSSDNKSMSIVLELSSPEYDANAGILTYIVKPIEGSSMPTIEDSLSVRHITLFIDDGPCEACW